MRNGLEHLKVLIAEDNEVNQLLLAGILRHWGVEAKIASTGFEVLDLIEKGDFNLVLMDIQMPQKSGIEAAGEIRKLKNTTKSNIPIIALTANALKGEEKKYKAVGMDDFLTKPFKEEELYEVITRVLDAQGSFSRKIIKDSTEMTTLIETQKQEALYNLVKLEEIASGNRDFLVSLAKIYLTTLPVNSGEMVAAAEKAEWDKVSKLAHKLKSTIDTMNMHSIQSDIRTLEIDAKNKVNIAALPALATKVDDVINKVAELLKEEFDL
ncbi:MAG TPA: response regulator [Segetibacter sp.]|jgi:CheY-like chemotaxis protein